MRALIPVTTVLALSLACGGTPPPPAPEEAPKADMEETKEEGHEGEAHEEGHDGHEAKGDGKAVHAHMQEHVAAVKKAREAVIAGNLPDAMGALQWLADHAPPADDLPDGWGPYVDTMQKQAREAVKAKGMAGVAKHVANVHASCGSCHADKGAQVAFPPPPALPESDGVASHMGRHRWAAARMAEGLIANDGSLWAQGAEALLEPHIDQLTRPNGEPAPAEATALAKQVHDLGADGLKAADTKTRAAIYGDFLAACGTCHLTTEGKPVDNVEE